MDLVEEVFGIDLSEFSENQGQGKTAYIIYGESVDDYREKWLGVMKQSIASIYMAEVLGYKPQVVYSRDSSETFEYMVQDDAPAIFYFGHLGKPSIDEVSSGDLPTQYKMAKKDNLERIYGEKRAHEMISEMGWDFFDSLGKDIFLNFSCFSADDSKLVERTVREGGVYFGHKGKLYPTEELEGFTRPFENK